MRRNIVIKTILVLLAVGLVVVGYSHFHHSKVPANTTQTTSKLPTAQNNYQNSSSDSHTPASSSVNQGGAIDEKGNAGSAATGGVSSSSGLITLLSPQDGDTLASGATISGSAKVPTVQYRLVDDTAGVIAQGPLSVVNGKFAGKLQFTSRGRTGSFAVFSFDPQTGAEVNSIKIKVGF